MNTEGLFAKWRKKQDEIDQEQRQVDEVLGKLSAQELSRIRDEAADEMERRPADKSKKEAVDQQRRDNQLEAAMLRRSDPTRPGVARATIYAEITRRNCG